MKLLVPEVKKRGYLRKSDLLKLSRWLSPRNKSRVLSNSCDSVEEMTALSFRSETERSRINHLKELHGVGLPMRRRYCTGFIVTVIPSGVGMRGRRCCLNGAQGCLNRSGGKRLYCFVGKWYPETRWTCER